MSQLMRLLPGYWQSSPEMNALQAALGGEMDKFNSAVDAAYLDARIMTASAKRITEWEQDLGISSDGRTLDQRRQFIISIFRGSGKLNEARIKNIVNAFTGGSAIVTFRDGTLTVKVLPPNAGETYMFPDVEKALSVRVPAHLELQVVRYYSTWDDISRDFATWDDVRNNLANWNAVKNYINE